ncbi:hypothetical protein BDL97_13G077500 [Sphagnum fallax]|nr:hypothetical protein BDL97_13G077500 [Sphagnum fallax]
MATIMSQMVSIKVGGLQALPAVQKSLTGRKLGDARLAPKFTTSATRGVRCESGGGRGPLADVQRAVDESTKHVITKDEILRNQEVNESEKQSVFGAKPNSGSFYPRPELERRPETGSKSFGSVFAFDGAAPETINCRLAMLGFAWAVVAEKMTGLTVLEQVFTPGTTGLVYFLGAVQLFTYASLVPIMNGESTDARSFGPFTAKAERWNGRLAMIGFFSLIVTELYTHTAFFH